MSVEFEFDISPKDAAAAYFMERNHRVLLEAALRAKKTKKISQREIAEMIGVNKSVISRALKGHNNLTERTIGELCWALGVEPKLVLEEIVTSNDRANETPVDLNVSLKAKSRSTSSHGGGYTPFTVLKNNKETREETLE